MTYSLPKYHLPSPPQCPSDCQVGPPDFVGVGAQRSGTSWWYSLLAKHPAIDHQRKKKELHFFDQFCVKDFSSEEDIYEYHRWFPRHKGKLTGEWTPRYMVDFWVPPLLKRAAPNAKLLLMLRDPVERFISGITFRVAHASPETHTSSAGICLLHFSRGLYYSQLRRLFEHFDQDQVLILQYERCRNAPVIELSRTFRFLGIDDTFASRIRLGEHVNVSEQKLSISESLRRYLIAAYKEDVHMLCTELNCIDLSLWSNFSK
jgi:Sulfotransferase domain